MPWEKFVLRPRKRERGESRLPSGACASFPDKEIICIDSSYLLAGWASHFDTGWWFARKKRGMTGFNTQWEAQTSRRSHPKPLTFRNYQLQLSMGNSSHSLCCACSLASKNQKRNMIRASLFYFSKWAFIDAYEWNMKE